MRQSLHNLFSSAIALQYKLPVNTPDGQLPKATITTCCDDCLRQLTNHTDISRLIYNGVVEYAFNDYEIDLSTLQNLQLRALQNRLKYNPNAPFATQIGYGFHAEVLLHLILDFFYHAQKCIARGYIYSPLANGETKGYDSYMMVEDANGRIYLLFGEAKAYIQGYKQSVDKIFESIDKALSDDYLNQNFLEMEGKLEKVNPHSRIPQIINVWQQNASINMAIEAQKYNMELVYPMFIMYDGKGRSYEESIWQVVDYINTTYPAIKPNLSLPHSLFFIFLPVDDCREIKKQVIEWISQQQPVQP